MADIMPSSISAGLTFEIIATLAAYQAPEWSLSVLLRGAQSIDLSATAEDNQHVIKASASETAEWSAGSYWYSVRVTDGTDVFEVEEGTLEIKQDLALVVDDYDGREHAQRVLDAIEAVIEGRASKDQERYRINNRELYRSSIGDLLKLRTFYRDEVRRKKAASNGQSLLGRKVLVRF